MILFLSLTSATHAQPGRDRVEALRVSFITKRVDLTSSEAERFWPVYNEYNEKIKALRKNLRQTFKTAGENLNDKSAEEACQLEIQTRQAEADLHRLYGERIRDIIGARKLVRLRLAEEEFKREMINTLKDRGE